jgi:hypothetical protein
MLLILAVLALAWSGGWYWLAGWADRRIPGWLAEAAESGIEVSCAKSDIIGFPFALRIDCGETAVAERETGTNAKLAGVTGGVSVFAPATAQVALASPAHIESPLLEGPADISWEDAEMDMGMSMSGPRDVSFDATDVLANFVLGDSDPAVAAAGASGTLSPSDAGGTEATLAFRDLIVSADGDTFPPVSGSASGHVSLPPRALASGRTALQTPLSANNVEVTLASGEARLQALGDVAIDAEGIVDGTVTLRIAGADALPAFIAALPPERQQIGNAIAGAIFAFGQPTTLDGEQASELVVEIERGEARIGPVEVTLPRLPL